MEMNELRLEAMDLNQQASTLLQAGNAEAAKEKLDRAIELDPMLMNSYKNYGDLYMATECYQDAKTAYKKAFLIEKNGMLYYLYGNACFMNDEPHEGLEYYNMAISNGYDGADMLFFMGMAYEHMDDDQMALRYFQKACIKNPSRPDYIAKKISTEIRMGMLDSAEKDVDDLLKTAPELYDGYHIKTQLLLNKGDYAEAEKFAKYATDRFPEDADLRYDYIKTIAMQQKLDEAVGMIDQASQMKYFEESKFKFLLLKSEVLAENNLYDESLEVCNQCIAMESEDFFSGEARFMAMNMHLAKPDFEASLEHANAIIERDEEDNYYFAALYYRAFCTRKLGKEEEAVKWYKEANSIYRLHTLKNPSAIDVYLYRAMCLKDLEQYDKALELLDFILALGTDIAEIHTLKADIYEATGKKASAAEEREKAFAQKPELRANYEEAGE